MNTFYRRIRWFCGLRVRHISAATGVSENRYREIEAGRRPPNSAEQQVIERFLRDKLRAVFAEEGPLPTGLRLGGDQ